MDHAEPVRTLGMAVARVVLQVPVVFDDGEDAHGQSKRRKVGRYEGKRVRK
jgi:hypothetical protein